MSSLRTPRSGARGTPIRQRPDVRSDRKVRQVNVGPNEVITLIINALLLVCLSN